MQEAVYIRAGIPAEEGNGDGDRAWGERIIGKGGSDGGGERSRADQGAGGTKDIYGMQIHPGAAGKRGLREMGGEGVPAVKGRGSKEQGFVDKGKKASGRPFVERGRECEPSVPEEDGLRFRETEGKG